MSLQNYGATFYGAKTIGTIKTSAEADICLNCSYEKCKPSTCKRVKEELKKLHSKGEQ